MQQRKFKLLSVLFAVLSFSLLFSACTREEEKTLNTEGNVEIDLVDKNPLLSRLPADSFFFLSFAGDSQAYHQYLSSHWGKSNKTMLDTVRDLQRSHMDLSKELSIFADVLEASQITDTEGKVQVNEGLVYSSFKEGEDPGFEFGYLFNTREGLKGETIARGISEALSSHNFKSEELTTLGDYGATITSSVSTFTLFIASKGEEIAASTSREHLADLLDTGVKTDTFSKLNQTTLYKRTVENLGNREKEYLFAYADLALVLNRLPQSLQENHQIKDIPVQSLAFSRQMLDTGPGEFVALGVTPRTEKEKQYAKILSEPGNIDSLKQFPHDTVAYFALDMEVWSKVFYHAMTEAERKERGLILQQLQSLSDLAVGIKGATGPSPFPEFLIGFNAKNPSEYLAFIESTLQALLPGFGLNVSPWQETDIGGVPVRYTMTPFGVGIYLGAVDEAGFMTSTSASAAEYIEVIRGKKPSLFNSLPEHQQALLQSTRPVSISVINFYKLGTLVEVFQNNLAMFTGGASIDQTSIEELKRAGLLALSVTYRNDVLQITTHFSEPDSKQLSAT